MSGSASRENGRRGGRPPGAETKPRVVRRSTLAARKITRMIDEDQAPLDVMAQNMRFWTDHAAAMTAKLSALITEDMTPDDRKAAMRVLDEMLRARDKSQQCAVDMAPYCHPRLQAIAFKDATKTVDAKAVVIPPDPVDASRTYLRLVQASTATAVTDIEESVSGV